MRRTVRAPRLGLIGRDPPHPSPAGHAKFASPRGRPNAAKSRETLKGVGNYVASDPSSTNCCRTLKTVLRLVSNATAIWLSVQPSPASDVPAFRRMRARVKSCAYRLAPPIIASRRSRSSVLNFTTYFLTPAPVSPTNHFHAHHHSEPTQIQRSSQVSRTRATRIESMIEERGEQTYYCDACNERTVPMRGCSCELCGHWNNVDTI